MNKVLTLMLALAMISMTTRAAMKKDSAKPKTEQVKKKKKDKTAKEFSNKKLYTFASKRGIMVMNAKGTGLTTRERQELCLPLRQRQALSLQSHCQEIPEC